MEQSGVLNIILYEDKNLNIVYNASNEIENIYTSGQEITIANDARIKFALGPIKLNNKLKYDYSIEFLFWDISLANLALVKALKQSIYGWKPLITFYNGDIKFINSIFTFSESSTENKESNFLIKMSNQLPTMQGFETWVGIELEGIGYWIIEDTFIVQ